MSVNTRALTDISEEMSALVGDERDPEATHSRADDLLLEAIMWLAAGTDRGVEHEAKNIVGNWRQLKKWYG